MYKDLGRSSHMFKFGILYLEECGKYTLPLVLFSVTGDILTRTLFNDPRLDFPRPDLVTPRYDEDNLHCGVWTNSIFTHDGDG
jgi:hypothetical protein